MKKIPAYLIIFSIIMAFTSACTGMKGLSAEDKAATAGVMAATIIYQTAQAAIPTATDTPIPSLTPTATEMLTSTPTSSPTVYFTDTPEYVRPTLTNTPFVASFKVTPLKFVNQTDEKVTFKFTSPIQDEYDASGTFLIKVPFGTYTYLAWVGEEGPFSGSIDVKGYDKIEVWFRIDRVKIVYP